VGIKILISLLRAFLTKHSDSQIAVGGGRRGEFDVTLANDSVLVFGEVKAKPLICFPLIVDAKPSREHSWRTPGVASSALHVGAGGLSIQLGIPDNPLWPIDRLPVIARDSNLVQKIEAAWFQQLEAYRAWTSEPDRLRWIRFGCGNFRATEGEVVIEKRVANTNELTRA
jgi:hypothetical protein